MLMMLKTSRKMKLKMKIVQKVKKMLNTLWVKFLIRFGNIKVFKFPLFIVYDPSEYKMDGPHVYRAMKILRPGDIILRGYD